MKRVMVWAVAVAVPILASCSDIAGGTDSIAFEFTASATSTVIGQEVEFSFSVRGVWLMGVTLDFGDGNTERIEGLGSLSLNGERAHTWELAGTYRVVATVQDGSLGTTSKEITIEVTAP